MVFLLGDIPTLAVGVIPIVGLILAGYSLKEPECKLLRKGGFIDCIAWPLLVGCSNARNHCHCFRLYRIVMG
jgi:hypothetical protein